MAPDLPLQQLSAASLALSGAAAKARRAAAAAQEEVAAAAGRECVAKVWGGGGERRGARMRARLVGPWPHLGHPATHPGRAGRASEVVL
jgi:hypothetical protein